MWYSSVAVLVALTRVACMVQLHTSKQQGIQACWQGAEFRVQSMYRANQDKVGARQSLGLLPIPPSTSIHHHPGCSPAVQLPALDPPFALRGFPLSQTNRARCYHHFIASCAFFHLATFLFRFTTRSTHHQTHHRHRQHGQKQNALLPRHH